MNIVKMILKEAGGRFENAAGNINSKDNMFAGSSGNAVSDKLGGGSGTDNPVNDPNEGTENAETISGTEEETTTPETTTETAPTDTTDTETDANTMSDENLKTYQTYKQNNPQSSGNKGKLKNLDLSPTSSKGVTSNSSGSGNGAMGMMGGMFQNIMGAGGGEDADSGADASDMGDMGDMADAADSAESDARLKNIFGDNEDAIKCFAKINAIEFTYNDKAHELPEGEKKGVDNDPHYGVKAQDLAENPLTASAVSRDPISDYLQIDTKELTAANTAIISEICKRILIIEKVLGIKVV